jgi:S-adenosylmethionine:tRNA ribosyltransferase-isomerase
MRAATTAHQRPHDAKLLVIDAQGRLQHAERSQLASLLRPGDLLVANDAATLPASLHGIHERSGQTIEVRLAGRHSLAVDDVREFTALVFGAGDHRTRTEDRPAPPALHAGDRLQLGPLHATVRGVLEHPRLIELRFDGTPDAIWAGLARHGKPIQYAHVPQPLALWDVWTQVAALPVAFEPPSAGFVLDWALLGALRERGVGFATLTHAAGISSTGDAVLDARLPFDEPYHLPASTVQAIERTRRAGGRVIALGTTVTRALEHAASLGTLHAGDGLATQRLGPHSRLRVVDAIISGTHEPGSSHYELLRAFTSDEVLRRSSEALERRGYLTHEFGDSVLIERTRPRGTASTLREGAALLGSGPALRSLERARQDLQAQPRDDDHRIDRHAHRAGHVEERRQHRRAEHALDEAAEAVEQHAAP